jgi:hypothetical protein
MKKLKTAWGEPVDVWKPLETDDFRFEGVIYQDPKMPTRKSVLLTRGYDRRHIARTGYAKGLTRLSYLDFDESRALFLGMYIQEELRGLKLGRHFLRYFMENVQETREFVGTGKIHKPVLALLLKKEGLVPVSENCQAEVLPHDTGDPDVPMIRFLRRDIPSSEIVSQAPHGEPFYEVAPHSMARKIPVNPGNVAALHTSYKPAPAEAAEAA